MSAHTSKNLLIYKDTNIEQKDHLECQKKIIRVLKDKFTNKENPTDSTRKYSVKENASKIVKAKYKKTLSRKDDETQTSPNVSSIGDNKDNEQQHNKGITAEDLTEESPSEYYWERLAKRRQLALEETLQENERLRRHIEGLESELKLTKKQFEEAKQLMEVLQEIIDENEAGEHTGQAESVEETEEEPESVDDVIKENNEDKDVN